MASNSVVLASGSKYRKSLLKRLGVPFKVWAPDVDESALPGELPRNTAVRLARLKAEAGGRQFTNSWIIGSDQVADLDGRCIGKPGTHQRASEQLRSMSGRTVVFHTAVAVLSRAAAFAGSAVVPITVRFRKLTDPEIERYLRAEQPYDCAGSAKCETLGIALLEAVESDDPTALIGLPLIKTCDLLRRAGIDPLADRTPAA